MTLALAEVARSINIAMAETSYNEYFSMIYDKALDILPYDEMRDFLIKNFKMHDTKPKSILDLGCGTGTLAILMKEAGFDITGLDLSAEMLTIATEKAMEKELFIPFINQSMSELELIGSYDVIYSFGDAINYVTEDEDLLATFKGVHKYLADDGLFIFDINSIDKFRGYGNNSFTESEEDFFYIWENEFDEEERLNYYYVELFVRLDDEDLYERSFETHTERAYLCDEIVESLKKAGFADIKTYTDMNFSAGSKSDDRLYFICKK